MLNFEYRIENSITIIYKLLQNVVIGSTAKELIKIFDSVVYHVL